MSDVNFTPSGPPETILPDPDPALLAALGSTSDLYEMRALAAAHPADPFAWASLGDCAREAGEPDITVYAYYRVGYHRGLDLLRKSGWKVPPCGPPPSSLGFLSYCGLAAAEWVNRTRSPALPVLAPTHLAEASPLATENTKRS